jgi:hypothetical protein
MSFSKHLQQLVMKLLGEANDLNNKPGMFSKEENKTFALAELIVL